MTDVAWMLNAVTPPSVFRRYIDHNMDRGLEEIAVGEPKDGPLYIVCSGPSLLEMWRELLDENGKPKGEIWALNAAFDWLCDKGIRPDYGICLAPENPVLRYFQRIEIGDRFLFAATTHPDLIDRALDRGADVTLWQSAQPADWKLPVHPGPHIYGGGTVGTRALDLAWTLGWRDLHVIGMDACLSIDGRVSVDSQIAEHDRERLKTFICNGRAFVALPSHARQVEDFAAITRPLTDTAITLYGDGLLQWSQMQPPGSHKNAN